MIQNVPYSVDLAYDAKTDRLMTMVYPGLGTAPRFAVEYGYKGNGELETVTAPGGAPEYWRATERNARGLATQETYGDGVKVSRTYEATRGLRGCPRTC